MANIGVRTFMGCSLCTAFLFCITTYYNRMGSMPLISHGLYSRYNPLRHHLTATDQHHVTTANATDQFHKAVTRFRLRKAKVKRVCQDEFKQIFPQTLSTHLFYAPSYNVFVCAIPKAGASSWTRHLLNMNGHHENLTVQQLHTPDKKSQVRAKNLLGTEETLRRFKTATSVITVRHPLARLVSAFRDKYSDGRPMSRKEVRFAYPAFWKPALKVFNKSSNSPLQLSFEQFVKFSMYNLPQERHWQPQNQLCSPCGLSYYYLFRVETLTEDLAFLATTLNISEIDSGTQLNKISSGAGVGANVKAESGGKDREMEGEKPPNHLALDNSSLQYYLQLPPHLLARVLNTYALDFKLFGYQIPLVLVDRAALATL